MRRPFAGRFQLSSKATQCCFGSFVQDKVFKTSSRRLEWMVHCCFDVSFLGSVALLVVNREYCFSKIMEELSVVGDLRVCLGIIDPALKYCYAAA
jgi:hypothetical protein